MRGTVDRGRLGQKLANHYRDQRQPKTAMLIKLHGTHD